MSKKPFSLIVNEDDKSFYILFSGTEMQPANFVCARSIDYTKPDGVGFDTGNYLEAKRVALKLVNLSNSKTR